MLKLSSWFPLLFVLMFASAPVFAVDNGKDTVEVLGVIASGSESQGIALVKIMRDGHTLAARVGDKVDGELGILRVTRDFVFFKSGDQITQVRVGEAYQAPSPYAIKGGDGGIERKGNEVRMTSAYRDLVLKGQLSKVLMQAAAVPYYVDGLLTGFRLWEIDQGSVFDQAGFTDGDIVTAINGHQLTDVGMTIRTLQAMKDEPRADITIVRKGHEEMISLVVQ